MLEPVVIELTFDSHCDFGTLMTNSSRVLLSKEKATRTGYSVSVMRTPEMPSEAGRE